MQQRLLVSVVALAVAASLGYGMARVRQDNPTAHAGHAAATAVPEEVAEGAGCPMSGGAEGRAVAGEHDACAVEAGAEMKHAVAGAEAAPGGDGCCPSEQHGAAAPAADAAVKAMPPGHPPVAAPAKP